jgi:DNA repair protein RecN (Recombination protein N)
MERERNRRIDWISFEIKEIESAEIKIGEDDELQRVKNILSNSEKISNFASSIYETLSGERGATAHLNSVSKDLTKWAEFDSSIQEYCTLLDSVIDSVRDISSIARDRGEQTEYDPQKLDSIISRLHFLDNLKRKYGPTLEDILLYLQDSKIKLQQLEHCGEQLGDLIIERDNYLNNWWNTAEKLSTIRKKQAKILQDEIVAELKDIGMKDSIFIIDIKSPEGDLPEVIEKNKLNICSVGFDRVEFKISLNPGIPEMSLTQIVSGGELSRIMLALKAIFARFRNFSTLVLDEIDTGIGGVTAEVVGEKLRKISNHRQVICITHLPVIASVAEHHLQISKSVENGETRTTLKPISGNERVNEVMRMIAGENAPEGTRKVVEKMLKGKK